MVTLYHATPDDLRRLKEEPVYEKWYPGYQTAPLTPEVFDSKDLIIFDIFETTYERGEMGKADPEKPSKHYWESVQNGRLREGLIEFLKHHRSKGKKLVLRSADFGEYGLNLLFGPPLNLGQYLDRYFTDDYMSYPTHNHPELEDKLPWWTVDLGRIVKEMGFSPEQAIHVDDGVWASSSLYHGVDMAMVPKFSEHPEFSFRSLMPAS